MKSSIVLFVTSALFSMALSASPARAALLLYEPFDYTAGTALNGKGGSEVGFDTGSTWTYSGSQSLTVNSGSITFGSYATVGHKARYTNSGTANLSEGASRPMDFAVSSGELWMSYLIQNDVATINNTGKGIMLDESTATSGGSYRNFSLFAKRNQTALNSLSYGNNATASSSAYDATNEQYMVIGKFTNLGTVGATATMWGITNAEYASIYADSAITEAELNVAVPSARIISAASTVATSLASTDSIVMIFVDMTSSSTNLAFSFDEIRVGTTLDDVTLSTVPEPASGGMFGLLGAGGLWLFRRRLLQSRS